MDNAVPQTQTSSLLSISDLRVSFATRNGVVRAVNGVNLQVGSGETVALVGESGSGKSAIVLAILGQLARTATVQGHILFDGRDLLQLSASEIRRVLGKRIGFIPQDPLTSLDPVFTVGFQMGEITRKHLGLRGNQAQESAVRLLNELRINQPESVVRQHPYQLSGGMRQRVVGAIAISCQPSLLLADEPTTSLDVTTQQQFLEILRLLRERSGAAMIFVTHDFSLVEGLCSRVAVMYAGRIVEQGRVDQVLTKPAHPYSQALLEAIPAIDKPRSAVRPIPGEPPDPREPPLGCPFRPRCPRAVERCAEEWPGATESSSGTVIHCWNPVP